MLENRFFVYILESLHERPHYYVGFTEDLQSRVKNHNQGKDVHTAKFRPWLIKTYVAFSNREQALAFERYLKTQSGRAFARKRL